MKAVETRTAKILMDEHGVLQILLFENVVVDYEDAIDNALVVRRLTKGKSCLKLIDIRNDVKIEAKAQQYLDSKDVQSKTLARAILINNSVKRLTLNFFIKFNSQQVPTKFFTEKEEAMEWLRGIGCCIL